MEKKYSALFVSLPLTPGLHKTGQRDSQQLHSALVKLKSIFFCLFFSKNGQPFTPLSKAPSLFPAKDPHMISLASGPWQIPASSYKETLLPSSPLKKSFACGTLVEDLS